MVLRQTIINRGYLGQVLGLKFTELVLSLKLLNQNVFYMSCHLD